MLTLLSLLFSTARGQQLSGDDGLRAVSAHLIVCESTEGTHHGIGILEGTGRCERALPARDNGCEELAEVYRNEPMFCGSLGEGGMTGNAEEALYLGFDLLDPSDLTGVLAHTAYSFQCTEKTEDGWQGDIVSQPGTAELTSDDGDTATLSLDLEGVQGTLTLDVCR